MQVSDLVHSSLGNSVKERGCNVGRGVALEFALFTTVFVCTLGVAAFLALTLTVEKDRRVSKVSLHLALLYITTLHAGRGEV